MKSLVQKIQSVAHESLMRMVHADQGELRPVPNYILGLTLFLCANVVFQGIADVLLKLFSYSSLLPTLPWRTDFLFLTAVSVLMGYRTLTGMHRRKFDVTRNSIELGVLVEIGLVVGDSQFIYSHIQSMPHILYMRLPFIVLTLLNIAILLYVYHALQLRSWLRSPEVLA